MSEKSKMNWLRAAVLGANDGIVSIAALVVGVAGATNDTATIATAGMAGLIAGALSMAAGEYVSVSTQRDAERAYIAKEEKELEEDPEGELEELIQYYRGKGLKRATAKQVSLELTEKDVLAAHLEAEFGLSEHDLTNPLNAAFASAVSFIAGGLIPIAAIIIPPSNLRVFVTFGSVVAALAVAGYISAKVSEANIANAIRRVIFGGTFAMIVTYTVGTIFSISV
ncbi:MAG TPA: VIT family protein [Candidatus Saccharibacteria bacterium]|jgi:VIT1/CCC1 family predicted Fe2+/Mn2+ transporter|nr:vacuolar iron transporter family protein [Patescibacteria group bacterium]HMS31377.1 VIT family protein [Candidatus Saccharibacteria bacterium]